MSQCRAGKRRSSLAIILALLPLLVSCSYSALEKFATENQAQDSAPSLSGGKGRGSGQKILTPASIIKGGKEKLSGVAGTFRRYLVGEGDEIRFMLPVAIGGVDDLLYIVDAGQRIVYRYNLTTKDIEPIGNIGVQFKGDPGDIYVTKDHTFYVVDSVGKQVLHFNDDGLLLNTFKDPLNLSRPMAVYVDETTREVYVADGSYSHIVVFNEFGKAMRAIGERGHGPGKFRAITAMARGIDGFYVTDRLELPIQVMTLDGQYRYSFGQAQQVYPTAIAVDANQLVFVSDKSDNTIRVYDNGELQAVVGGGGAAPGHFRLITGLYVKGQNLYVADSLNRRIQVMHITPKHRPMPTLPSDS